MFGRVVGHERARRLLEAGIRAGRPGHAYLLTGPDMVGKATLARAFAQALNCTGPLDERPCGVCDSCRRFAAGNHPDFRAIDRTTGAADERRARTQKNIPIEAVRALQHDAALTSHLGGYKLYLIDGAEDLSDQAKDALLKTLEEPPAHVVILLTATDVGLLPLTIVSRCQVVKLSGVPVDAIAAHLVAAHGQAPEAADLIAHLASGRPGRAIALAGDADALAARATTLDEIGALEAGGKAERLKEVERFATEHARSADATARRLEALLGWWRDLLLARVGCEELIVNRDRLESLRARAARLSPEQIQGAIRAIEQTEQYVLRENVQARLALEALALALP